MLKMFTFGQVAFFGAIGIACLDSKLGYWSIGAVVVYLFAVSFANPEVKAKED